jgi:hypothetical protein
MNRAGRITSVITLGIVVAVVSGCSDGSVSLGDAPGGQQQVQNTTVVWDGYIENYQLTSGSDAVHIELDISASPVVTGTVLLGSASILPPASDPDVGYPSGLDSNGPPGNRPYEGFEFTATDGDLTQDRLRFTISTREVWAGWCALQTPVLSEGADPPFYACLPNSYSFEGGCVLGGAPVDCGKLYLCNLSRTCDCTVAGCSAAPGEDLSFDLLVDKDEAHGSVTGLSYTTAYNVWLTESP